MVKFKAIMLCLIWNYKKATQWTTPTTTLGDLLSLSKAQSPLHHAKCELVCDKYLVLPEGGEDKVHLDEDASKR